MVFNGLLANAQFIGDLLVKIALSDIIKDFYLSRGEGADDSFGLSPPGELLKLL